MTAASVPDPATAAGKPKKPTREETAQNEVGHTDVGPTTARVLTIAFLALIVLVPLLDCVAQVRTGGLNDVRALDLVRSPPALSDFTVPIHRVAAAEKNPFRDHESAVEKTSLIRTACQSYIQELLTGALHGGTSTVVMGEADWLFYRAGVDYVAFPGFLDGAQHRMLHRLRPDPRPAVLRMAKDCRAAGVRLVLLPIPDKAQIHPGKIASGFRDGQPLDNPDFPRLVAEMRTAGVEVIDVAPLMRGLAATGPAYLRQDTHWTPATMEVVATAVATQLALPATAAPRAWTSTPRRSSRLGDLADMLKLPAGQTIFRPQEVEIRPVADDAGRPFSPTAGAEVLLLGDSFTNIYGDRPRQTAADGALGWGESAGFAARLAYHLKHDLDVIAINGSGANGTRRELAKRPGQLAGTALVIWQFSARDLATADWDVIPLARTAVPASVPTSAAGAIELSVRLTTVSAVKQPGSVPYTEALTTVKATVMAVTGGTYTQAEVLLVAACMEANKLTDFARLRAGALISVRLVPWTQVQARQGTKNTYDDTDEVDLARWWVASWSQSSLPP